MVMAELEAARPRPKSRSFSPVLKRDKETRVKDVFLWFPCIVSVNKMGKHLSDSDHVHIVLYILPR